VAQRTPIKAIDEETFMKHVLRTGLLTGALLAATLIASCGGGGGSDPAPASPASPLNTRKSALSMRVNAPIPADASTKGMFGPLQSWPLIAVHGVLTSDGRVMSYGTRETGQQTGFFIYDVWDPSDGSHLTLPNGTQTDIFCSSQLLLPDSASIVISGGDNWTGTATNNQPNNNSNLFNLAAGSLTRGNNMNRPRWYGSSTMLLSGEIYVQGGSGGTDLPEIRGADGNYRLLSGAGTSSLYFMYPRNFIAPDGRVFGFDALGNMYYVDPAGNGTFTPAGQFGNAIAGTDTSAAMFAPGRILQYGGNSNQAIVVDITDGSPVVTATGSMLRQRRLSSATLLADGQVVATGGSRVWNAMTDVSYEAEIWNPQTGQWTLGASAQKARLYHGNALLLRDASVLVFGGGAPGPQNNTNAEIYYPPYLFTADGTFAARPVIEAAPTLVDPGRTLRLTVSSGRPVSRVSFVKTGSATHGWNMDQRFVDLPFTGQGPTLAVQIPGRASDVPPGTWMLFVIDDAGVPSEATMVRVNVAGALNTAVQPVLSAPGDQSSVIGSAASLQLAATDPNGDVLTYSASGLPPELSIDPASGLISGTPGTVGSYSVIVAASDGVNNSSTTITWTVTGTVPLVLAPPTAAAPSTVGGVAAFSASATGLNVRYRWDFGDGSAPTDWSASADANHVFARAGVFYVSVTATDDRGVEQRQSFIHLAHLPLTANAPLASTPIALESRGGQNARLWVVNPDNDSVSVFDAVTRAKLAEVPVGSAPRTLAIAPDGSVWVTNKGAASVSVISASTLAVSRTIALPRASRPHGIAMARASGTALVALEASGSLLKIDTSTFAAVAALALGPDPRHVSVAADGATAYVSRFITPPLPGESTTAVQTTANGNPVGAEVLVVDSGAMSLRRTIVLRHSDKPDVENQGRGFPNYLGAAAISPDGSHAFVPSKQDNLQRGGARDGMALNFQSTVRAISSRIDLVSQAEDAPARIDHDNASVASAAAYDPLGVYLFVALETSREVAVLDAHGRNQIMRIDVGRAPQGLAVSADGKTLYVHNFMDRSVGVFDLTPLTVQGRASVTPLATLGSVGAEKLDASVLRGKQFFYDARDTRLARDGYLSCATCHNDGGHDGRVWDFSSQGEGLRNTIALRGRAGAQGRLHWSNNFDEVQDFEGQIRSLAGGTGLMSDAQFNTGSRAQALGDAKAGVSSDLDALAAYVSSLARFDPSPWRTGSGALSTLAEEGKLVFSNQNCASCHSGSAFTRSDVDNPANIGTLKPSSGQRLSGPLTGIDVPTLRDVWATAPYLHDGSAATLDAAVRAHKGINLADADMNRLVSYLREIGSEEAGAPSSVSGGGLVGTYFDGLALAGSPLLTRTEAVDFDWGSGSPGSPVPSNDFSVRWTGTLTIPVSGTYRLRTVSDDGVRLWLDGTQRIDNWTDHGVTNNRTASLALTAGQRVGVTLEYYERRGQAVMRLQWRRPGTSSYVTIPVDNLNAN
jgi:YVTN family beta-propeller protein